MLLAAAVLLGSGSGCVFVSSGPTKGDIALQWEFDGTLSCELAGVEDVFVSIRGQDTSDAHEVVMNCGAGGGRFTDFLEGEYTIHLEGLDYSGAVRYAATVNASVLAGSVNDLGWIVLYPSTPPPPPTGSMSVDWAFLYPTDEPTLDCAYAGVDYVGVRVWDDYNHLMLDQSVNCLDGPAVFDLFDPGAYTVQLFGYGTYQGHSVTLYQSPVYDFDIYAGELSTIGVIDLEQIPGQFGDFEIWWSFGGNNSCAAVGVDMVQVDIYRYGAAEPEDWFDVYCDEEPQTRYSFVPGEYEIVVEADGYPGEHWYGYVAVDLPPGTLADVTVQTELTY